MEGILFAVGQVESRVTSGIGRWWCIPLHLVYAGADGTQHQFVRPGFATRAKAREVRRRMRSWVGMRVRIG